MNAIKVGVRVRPLSDNEVNDGCSSCLSYPLQDNQIMIGMDKLFAFDFVFTESHSQEYVYNATALPMVVNLLKGYNATIFAYGQTGSGKTYTMGTAVSDDLDIPPGVVSRMVADIFDKIVDCDYDFVTRMSFLEIPGLSEFVVNSAEEVIKYLKLGAVNRSVGGTAMNLKSSRSHAIITLSFVFRAKATEDTKDNADGVDNNDVLFTDETLTSKLHIVDLAGSERIKKTHAVGDRLKEDGSINVYFDRVTREIGIYKWLRIPHSYFCEREFGFNGPVIRATIETTLFRTGININKGLLCLGNVITALCERDTKKRLHIPYRDSKLTRLLQDSLGGNSMTLMLACVSPADCNMEETLNTLRYADRARLIKNKPILNRADPKDAEIARLRALVIQLQARLASGSSFPIPSPCPKLLNMARSSKFSTKSSTNIIKKETGTEFVNGDHDLLLTDANEVEKDYDDENINLDEIKPSSLSVIEFNGLDDEESKFHTRRAICEERIESIEAHINQKNKILEKLESMADQGEDSYAQLLLQYESQIRELESRITDLECEKAKLISEQNNGSEKQNSQREIRLKTMEQELNQSRRQLVELTRLKKAKEARESECLRLRNEIQTLKSSLIRSTKQLKEDNSLYSRWRADKELQIRKLQEHDRRLQFEMSRMASIHERQQTVLKRRIEAASVAERRLKELLLRQKQNYSNKDMRHSNNLLNKKSDFSAQVRSWVMSDLEIEVSVGEVRHHLKRLLDLRKVHSDELRLVESNVANAQERGESVDGYIAEAAVLTEAIERQTQQIGDLQQKLLDAGESLSADGSAPGSTDQMLASRLAQLHNVQEARIAIKILFKQTVTSQVEKLVLESQLSDFESQLSNEKERFENIYKIATNYSIQLLKLEEEKRELVKQNESMKYEVLELQEIVKQKEKQSKPEFKRLSGTPIFKEKFYNARTSSDVSETAPIILVPDSVGKRVHDVDSCQLFEPKSKKLSETESFSPLASDDDHLENLGSNLNEIRSVRCKCRGACQARCSCKRSGQMCLDNTCQCVFGVCKNRSPSTDDDSTMMKPPTDLPLVQKSKKRSHTLQLKSPVNKLSQSPNGLNTTFDIGHPKIHDFNDIQSPDVSNILNNFREKHLWPKSRLSYFPSPSLRHDV